MTVDIEEIKQRYAALTDGEFRAVRRGELTPAARACYENELAARRLTG